MDFNAPDAEQLAHRNAKLGVRRAMTSVRKAVASVKNLKNAKIQGYSNPYSPEEVARFAVALQEKSKEYKRDNNGYFRQKELLHPHALKLCEEMEQVARDNFDIKVLITATYRRPATQNKLFQQGITRARPWQSMHQYGLAWHFVPVNADGSLCWDANDWRYKQLAQSARSLGITTGIDWNDAVHYSVNICGGKRLEGWQKIIPHL